MEEAGVLREWVGAITTTYTLEEKTVAGGLHVRIHLYVRGHGDDDSEARSGEGSGASDRSWRNGMECTDWMDRRRAQPRMGRLNRI